MRTTIRALATNDDVARFDCGVPALNAWLQNTARQHQKKSLSGTFVLVDDDAPGEILGYYALSIRIMTASADLPPEMAKRLPSNVPGLTIARLAVSKDAHGRGHGEHLLVDAMQRAKQVARQVGGTLLFVDAKHVGVAGFYRKYGFIPFPSDELTLCLKITDIP